MNPIPTVARIFWTVYFVGLLVTLAAGGPGLALLWWAGFPVTACLGAAAVIAAARLFTEWERDLEEFGPDRYVPAPRAMHEAIRNRPALRLLARRR